MRRFLSLFILLLFTCGLIINDAQAKRFGGGRSFGVQRSISSFSRPQSSGFSRPGMQTNKWLGPLTGLALGGILASLFMGHGIGTGILTWLMLGLAFLAILNLLRKKTPSAAHAAHYSERNENVARHFSSPFMTNNNQSINAAHQPAGFDADTFMRDAKVCFLRLQTAYDRKNLNDLREFTTPEVFAEIQLQLQERGDEANQTDVVSLNSELLDATAQSQGMINSSADTLIASVRFSGLVRENSDKISTSINEIWHFRKDTVSSSWLVSGIQQNQ